MSQQEVKKMQEENLDKGKEKLIPKFEFHSIPETSTVPFTDNFNFSEGLARSENLVDT